MCRIKYEILIPYFSSNSPLDSPTRSTSQLHDPLSLSLSLSLSVNNPLSPVPVTHKNMPTSAPFSGTGTTYKYPHPQRGTNVLSLETN
jgi:hypothetical protein